MAVKIDLHSVWRIDGNESFGRGFVIMGGDENG